MNDSQSLYSVPRKLDLATLLVLTACYGSLFALMKITRFRVQDVIAVTGFFTCVGVAQAVLFRGNKPREASSVAGAVYITIGMLPPFSTRFMDWSDWEMIAMTIGFGLTVGYFSGVLVAGIFLLIDRLRVRIRKLSSTKEDRSELFDDLQ